MKAEVFGSKDGNCGLCIGKSAGTKEVFVVKSSAYCGEICPKHLAVLVKNGKHEEGTTEPTLFEKAS